MKDPWGFHSLAQGVLCARSGEAGGRKTLGQIGESRDVGGRGRLVEGKEGTIHVCYHPFQVGDRQFAATIQ